MPLGLHKYLDSKVNKKKTKQQKINLIKNYYFKNQLIFPLNILC